jgi:hypothetical protein
MGQIMADDERPYRRQRIREELEKAADAKTGPARAAHMDLAILHLRACCRSVGLCDEQAQCSFACSCAVVGRLTQGSD